MFCFQAHFNVYFLLYTTLLALAFWSLVTLLRVIDPDAIASASRSVPVRGVATYLFVCLAFFAVAWLQALVPTVLHDTTPAAMAEAGVTQNTVWVLDFAFTFPLTALGGLWLWRREPWGYVVAAMMIVMTTLETAGIEIDQTFGHLHDPSASMAAVPVMVGFTAVGLAATWIFLRAVHDPASEAPRTRSGSRLPPSGLRPTIRA